MSFLNFAEFFTALWPGREPFPWQTMLAQHPAWPVAIDLPTASGKTACIDAAIYRVATGAPGNEGQPMPRRMWFVVDRRIVVDEAFHRASAIAEKLRTAKSGPLKEIAVKLQALSGTGIPLAVARLRGGTWRDDKSWASDPRQPAIVCTTVDQIGSSLLFRAYGHGDLTASVYAGLAANDSLIILDEAHCSEAFRQTLEAIGRFRQKPWSPEPPPAPFAYTIMSATLSEELQKDVFPALESRAAALDHPDLQRRINAEKLATLVAVKDAEFYNKAADLAVESIGKGLRRIAIMVNRVATARQIFNLLTLSHTAYTPVLITGRMRPIDRDQLIKEWSPRLASSPTEDPEKPIVVVTTQCLEVGADFSFDALVTECAGLDALRQRFGRLDRLGKIGHTEATILIRKEQTKEPDDKKADPIYGKAIYHTWAWLKSFGETVDFGINAMDQHLASLEKQDEVADPEQPLLLKMLAPKPDAPILLPGHLDLLCQTGPRPAVEPEISFYLHGKGRISAEVRVIFRSDCPNDKNPKLLQEYLTTLTLLPPTSPEALSVPLHRLRNWLADQKSQDLTGDVEGSAEDLEESDHNQFFQRTRPYIRWRGKKESHICHRDIDLHNGDTIILPARREIFDALGQLPEQPEGTGSDRLDLAEWATLQAKGKAALRITPGVWEPWLEIPGVRALLDCAENEEPERDDLKAALAALLESELTTRRMIKGLSPGDEPTPCLPDWLLALLRRFCRHSFQVLPINGGIILLCHRRFRGRQAIESDPFDEDDSDERSRSNNNRGDVMLADHTAQVQRLAASFGANLWPAIVDDIDRAAFSHDLGKLDPRFQFILCGGNPLALDATPLAKSTKLPSTPQKRYEIEEAQHLPPGFRHEMLSAQIASHLRIAGSPLSLHLVTSHHGHSRPFAPIIADTTKSQLAAGALRSDCLGLPEVPAADRSSFTQPHQLSEDHANRFWLLTRRHGWWGLAYAESLLRLADWVASAQPEAKLAIPVPPTPLPPEPSRARTTRDLPGIDGSNPLGALAALGVLRCLTHAWPTRDVRLHWKILNGGWKAVISYDPEPSALDDNNEVVEALARVLKLGFKPQSKGWEAREQAQRELETVQARINEVKASIKQRKLKGEQKQSAETVELETWKQKLNELQQAIIDPTDLAKKVFDAKKKQVKDEVNALKERKLKGAEQKAARSKLVEPLEAELAQLREAWLGLLRTAVPFSEMALGDRPDVPTDGYRDFASQSVAWDDRWAVEMFCHFGSDGSSKWSKQRGCHITNPTHLCFTNGSGNQWFLKTARDLTQCVTPEKLHQALFKSWVPTDMNNSMRWLPSEDRRYALMDRDTQSSDNKTLTLWAANLLGYAGLGLLPSAPGKYSLQTTGIVTGEKGKDPIFRWPLWREPLSAAAVTSLFAFAETSSPAATHRQSTRIEVGDGANKKINFTPSVAR